MANWVTIENNEITGYYDLIPTNWRHISGLDKSANDLEFLKNLGWFPVIRQDPGDYDIDNYELGRFEYEIQTDSVWEIPVVTPRPQVAPTPTFEQRKAEFMTQLREARNNLLAKSDYTQLQDVYQNLDETAQIQWATYRQALRDIPAKYEDNDILSLENVAWPEV